MQSIRTMDALYKIGVSGDVVSPNLQRCSSIAYRNLGFLNKIQRQWNLSKSGCAVYNVRSENCVGKRWITIALQSG